MTGKTVTRSDLAEAVYREIGLSRNESAKIVESVLLLIEDSLVNGETVKLSSFGSFSVKQKTQRIGRNPKTGEEVPILPRKVLTFRASHVLKDLVNSIPEVFEEDLKNQSQISDNSKTVFSKETSASWNNPSSGDNSES